MLYSLCYFGTLTARANWGARGLCILAIVASCCLGVVSPYQVVGWRLSPIGAEPPRSHRLGTAVLAYVLVGYPPHPSRYFPPPQLPLKPRGVEVHVWGLEGVSSFGA